MGASLKPLRSAGLALLALTVPATVRAVASAFTPRHQR